MDDDVKQLIAQGASNEEVKQGLEMAQEQMERAINLSVQKQRVMQKEPSGPMDNSSIPAIPESSVGQEIHRMSSNNQDQN